MQNVAMCIRNSFILSVTIASKGVHEPKFLYIFSSQTMRHDAASDYKEICEGLSAKLVLCIVISLIKTFSGFFSPFSISLPLLREKIEGLLAFSVASFSPKGTYVEPGLVTLQPSVETIELLCVCACVVQHTRGTVFRGLCDRICSCLALLRPNEICINAEEKLIRWPKNTGFFDIVLVRPSP